MNGAPTIDDVIAERVLARLDTEPVGFREVDTLGEDLQALEEEWIAAHARADECSLDFDLEEQIGHDRWVKRCAALNQLAEEKLRALAEERHQHDTELSLGRSAHAIADDWRNGRLDDR